MIKSLRFLKGAILLTLIFLILIVCFHAVGDALTSARVIEGVKLFCASDKLIITLGILIILQIIAMNCSGFIMEQLLTLFSILLFAEMATIALGPEISLTSELQQLAAGVGQPNPLKANPALYWLIPLVWFLSLLGAKHQVRAFCSALVCYVLWLVLSPIVQTAVADWAASDSDILPQLKGLMDGAAWMPSLILGAFFLLFSLILSILDNIIPDKKAPQA